MTFEEGFRQFNELIDELIEHGMTEEEAIIAAGESGLLERQKDKFDPDWEEQGIDYILKTIDKLID